MANHFNSYPEIPTLFPGLFSSPRRRKSLGTRSPEIHKNLNSFTFHSTGVLKTTPTRDRGRFVFSGNMQSPSLSPSLAQKVNLWERKHIKRKIQQLRRRESAFQFWTDNTINIIRMVSYIFYVTNV